MLRLIIGSTRRQTTSSTTANATTTTTSDNATNETTSLEPWIDYIKRATAIAEAQLQKLHIDDWPTTYLRRKWRWAARVATHPHDRWTLLAAQWQPQFQLERRSLRRPCRPHKQWGDDLTTFLTTTSSHQLQGTNWLCAAATSEWQGLEDTYVEWALSSNQQHPRE